MTNHWCGEECDGSLPQVRQCVTEELHVTVQSWFRWRAWETIIAHVKTDTSPLELQAVQILGFLYHVTNKISFIFYLQIPPFPRLSKNCEQSNQGVEGLEKGL